MLPCIHKRPVWVSARNAMFLKYGFCILDPGDVAYYTGMSNLKEAFNSHMRNVGPWSIGPIWDFSNPSWPLFGQRTGNQKMFVPPNTIQNSNGYMTSLPRTLFWLHRFPFQNLLSIRISLWISIHPPPPPSPPSPVIKASPRTRTRTRCIPNLTPPTTPRTRSWTRMTWLRRRILCSPNLTPPPLCLRSLTPTCRRLLPPSHLPRVSTLDELAFLLNLNFELCCLGC